MFPLLLDRNLQEESERPSQIRFRPAQLIVHPFPGILVSKRSENLLIGFRSLFILGKWRRLYRYPAVRTHPWCVWGLDFHNNAIEFSFSIWTYYLAKISQKILVLPVFWDSYRVIFSKLVIFHFSEQFSVVFQFWVEKCRFHH